MLLDNKLRLENYVYIWHYIYVLINLFRKCVAPFPNEIMYYAYISKCICLHIYNLFRHPCIVWCVLVYLAPGVPRMLAVTQCGGEANFQTALASGDLEEVQGEDGRVFFAWKEVRTGTRHGTRKSMSINRGRQIGDEDFKKFSALLDGYGWSLPPKAVSAAAALPPGAPLPEVVWEKVDLALSGVAKA